MGVVSVATITAGIMAASTIWARYLAFTLFL